MSHPARTALGAPLLCVTGVITLLLTTALIGGGLVAGGTAQGLAEGLTGRLAGNLANGTATHGGSRPAAGSRRPGGVPTGYVTLLLLAGKTCDAAPAHLLAAQVEAESGWDPDARSSAGALGIAQFLPSTWARWGADANGDGRADVHDPRDAIPAQARYDCALAADMAAARRSGRVRGRPTELMLAAYNAGPAAVLAAGGVPAFDETRRYVDRIVARAAALAAGPELAAPERLAAPGPFADRLLRFAASRLGTPYAWGGGTLDGPGPGVDAGAGTVGFDCSALVRYAAYQASDGAIVLPRTADAQSRAGEPVPLGRLRPGDVVGFTRPGETQAHHIGIYAGNDRMIHAPETGGVVRVESLRTPYWRSQRWRAVRYGR